MTTATTYTLPKAPLPAEYRLPNAPENHDDKMTSAKHLSETGSHRYLIIHFGKPESTIISGDRMLTRNRPLRGAAGSLYPDLIIAFNVNPAMYELRNGYVTSEQGKPPDFVLEIASRSTGNDDITKKRDAYAELGVPEYWRFDETGEYHGARLAGDRLVDGRYEPINIDELPGDVLQGYSPVLNLYLRWEDSQLAWYDPDTGRHIATFESERERADAERERANAAQAHANLAETQADAERAARTRAETQADAERAARTRAETRAADAQTQADAERAARLHAEARIAELEAENRRLRSP